MNSDRAEMGDRVGETRQQQSLSQQIQKIEEDSIKSTMRSIGVLRSTEDIGNATAEELAIQREKLESTERNLDQINSSLRVTQRNINGIRSIFCSMKNYFWKSKETTTQQSNEMENVKIQKPTSALSALLADADRTESEHNSNDFSDHPSTQLRADNADYAEDVDKVLDKNIGIMSDSLSYLKGLAVKLGETVQTDVEIIDRISVKAENADLKIKDQDNQMQRILKK